jgi:hypothetical protein
MAADFWIRGAIGFGSTLVADIIWTRYIARAAEKRKEAVKAANWAALLILPGAINIINTAHDPKLVGFGFAGAWIGTYVALRFGPE